MRPLPWHEGQARVHSQATAAALPARTSKRKPSPPHEGHERTGVEGGWVIFLEEKISRGDTEALAGGGEQHQLEAALVFAPRHSPRPRRDPLAQRRTCLQRSGARQLTQGALESAHSGRPVAFA